MSACDTLSLQPLYSEEDTTTEFAVTGSWKADGDRTICIVTETKPGVYSVIVEGKSTDRFEARLTRIGQVLFADFLPVERGYFQIPGHLFARVRVDGATMRIAWVDFKWLARQIRPLSFPAHQFVFFGNDNSLVLTAPTADLRTYLEKIAGLPEAFERDDIFQREGQGK
ncbi:MAG: hypothetical protein EXQ52_02465 [Bryobacterales bacterium]|nr:hypothetical protein [Bryobacterales bacterium]